MVGGCTSVVAVWDLPKKSNFEGFRFGGLCLSYLHMNQTLIQLMHRFQVMSACCLSPQASLPSLQEPDTKHHWTRINYVKATDCSAAALIKLVYRKTTGL